MFVCVAENVRARSAAPKKVRPLGQPRNGGVKESRRVRSADATVASRKLVKSEEKQAEQASKPEEKQVDPVSKPKEKQADQVSKPEEKQDGQVSKPEEEQVDQVSSEMQKPQEEVGSLSETVENDLSVGKLQWHYTSRKTFS